MEWGMAAAARRGITAVPDSSNYSLATTHTTLAYMQFSLLVTCMGDVLRPAAAQSLVRLLRRLGHEVDFPAAQTCCGQPFYNSGFGELAREQAQHTIGVFAGERTVVVPSGSCAAMVKVEYPRLFQDDAAL